MSIDKRDPRPPHESIRIEPVGTFACASCGREQRLMSARYAHDATGARVRVCRAKECRP